MIYGFLVLSFKLLYSHRTLFTVQRQYSLKESKYTRNLTNYRKKVTLISSHLVMCSAFLRVVTDLLTYLCLLLAHQRAVCAAE